eukprot:scaffold5530_cov283-Chaetoceros_neogracile.AAC.14
MALAYEEEKMQLGNDQKAYIQEGSSVAAETEVERFKREREERIKGNALAQSIKMEEEARRAEDLARAKQREKAEAKARLENELKAGQQEAARLQAKQEDRERIEAEREQAAKLQAEANERRLVEANQQEAARLEAAIVSNESATQPTALNTEFATSSEGQEASLFVTSGLNTENDLNTKAEEIKLQLVEAEQQEAIRMQNEENDRLLIEAEQQEAARFQAEQEGREQIEQAARLQAEDEEIKRRLVEAEQQEAIRKQNEENDRLLIEAEQQEAARLQAEQEGRERIGAEREEEARLQVEDNERRLVEAEQQEAIRKQNEENDQLLIEAEQQEAARLQAEQEGRERIEAEREEAARLQVEDNERRLVEANQKEAARLEAAVLLRQRIITENSMALKQGEINNAHLQSTAIDENSINEFRGDAVRPGSATLRNRRRHIEEKEGQLRGLMRGASSSADDESVSSTSTYQTMETSLVSHSKNLSSGKNLQWEDTSLFICFGLLTTIEECPKEGTYGPDSHLVNKHILRSIMKKVKKLSKTVIEERSGNVLMKCHQPFITSVKRKEFLNEHKRPGVVRSFVCATIPLKITDIHEELNNTSKIVAKVMIRQALIEVAHRYNSRTGL